MCPFAAEDHLVAPRILLTLTSTLFLGGALLVACGGGDSSDPDATAEAPTVTVDSRPLQPGNTPANTSGSGGTNTNADATATPDGPLPPEGAVPRIDTRRQTSGNSETVSDVVEEDVDEETVRFVAPLTDWDSIGDRFGVERGEGLYHGGIDFLLDSQPNAPIFAACDGWVAAITNSPTHSDYMVVKCGASKWTTVYAHIGETLVKLNDEVVAGETIIARSGGTTRWGHAMLHFELRWDFVPADPESWIDFNVRPDRTIPTPTPTATPTPEPTATPEPGATNTPVSSGGNPGGGGSNSGGGSSPSAPPPTATPTFTPTATPTATPWIQPTATPVPPTPTPTRIPIAPPTPTPTFAAPEPTQEGSGPGFGVF